MIKLMKLMKDNKLYLDTSVICAHNDFSKPLRQLITQKWFENEAKDYELFLSVVTTKEINNFHEFKKQNVLKIIENYQVNILDYTDDAKKLAQEYIEKGAIPPTEPEDAAHIAIATINNIEFLASWNFSHIVSVNPVRKVHEINRKNNYMQIEIRTIEFYGGAKYGKL